MTKELVFVYGTLKKGHWNHGWMERAKGTLLNSASLPKHKIFFVGSPAGFPGIVSSQDDKDVVHGELYECEDAFSMDRLEGYSSSDEDGSMYLRRLVNVKTPDGENHKAWCYIWNSGYQQDLIIPSGNWPEKCLRQISNEHNTTAFNND